MNFILDYFKYYSPQGLIYIRCEGETNEYKVKYTLYEGCNAISYKQAEGDELVIFRAPYTAVYKISAEIDSSQDNCQILWTDPIEVTENIWQPPQKRLEGIDFKGKLKIVEGEDNYIELKFYDGGYDKFFNEDPRRLPLCYKYRHYLDFKPAFVKELIDLKCKLTPIYAELCNYYSLDIDICDNGEILALAQELESLDYVEFCALLSKIKYPLPPDDLYAPCADNDVTQIQEAALYPDIQYGAGDDIEDTRYRRYSVPREEYSGPGYGPGTPLNGPTPDFTPLQGYLDEGLGMNVRAAWNRGVTGNGAAVRIMEYGVHPNHEDIRGNITIVHNRWGGGNHGTAAVGIIRGINNGFGVTGIAFGCRLFFYETDMNNLNQIMMELIPGDVVVINMQIGPVQGVLLPIVNNPAWWERINWCVRAGAVVIHAAGNGATNILAHPQFNNFGDSGAIMIGGSNSWDGRRTGGASGSNFNLYSTLNSWGNNVTTAGYGGLQNFDPPNRTYTTVFGGTSSATPLVGGAITLVQAHARTQHHLVFRTEQMFEILSQTGSHEAQGDGIGVRPNVAAALTRVDEIASGGLLPPPPPPPTPPVFPYPLWMLGVRYTPPERVSYKWSSWQCTQAHTSIASWAPGVAASLWRLIS